MQRPRLTLLLVCATLLGATTLPAAAHEKVATHVGRFRFLSHAATIVVPLVPPLPSLAWDVRSRRAGRVAYLEVPGLGDVPAVLEGRTRSINLHHGWVRRVLVAQNRPGVVRVAVRAIRPIRLLPSLAHPRAGWILRIQVVPTGRRPRARGHRVGDFGQL